MLILLNLLEAALLLEEREAARALAWLLNVVRSMSWTFVANTCPARLLGAAAALLGKPDQARAYYQQALDVCAKIRFRPEIALTRLQLGELLLQHYRAERATALEHIDFAINEFEEMKMQPALERALRLRGRRRPPSKRAEPAYPDGLSEREVQVLRLIAAGKSNRQIADDLFISLNTVARHISNVFAKTRVANRTEAAAYAHRQGLV